jgi:hypothetical protein
VARQQGLSVAEAEVDAEPTPVATTH